MASSTKTESSSILELLRDGIAPLTAYAPAPAPAIKLDANESPFPLPEEARQRIATDLASIEYHRYPDPRAIELRAALANREGFTPDRIILGAGSDEVIALLMLALSRPRTDEPATVLFAGPTFVMYRMTSITHGLRPIEVPLGPRFELDADAMCDAIDRYRPNLVFLASPNNPTGNTYDSAAIRRIVEHDRGVLIMLDEAYGPFTGASLSSFAMQYAHVGLLGTLSKIGFAAARVGWAILPREIAHEIDKARQPYNLGTLSQRLATLVLTEFADLVEEQAKRIVTERERLFRELQRLDGFDPFPTEANFILVRLDHDASALARQLREKEIAIREFEGHPRLHGHVRITVGTPAENDHLLAALESID